ncbi:MAG: ABC transporter ATP-binding protein [Bacteroidota bacterium]
MKAVEINNLTKNFKQNCAINSFSLEIEKGEMFALVGPDGAGKSTLIKMMCGIVSATSGNIKLFDYDIKNNINEIKKRIGYLSQKFSLYGDLTIDENIEFFAEIHGVNNYEARRNELLNFTRLTNFRNRLAAKLSGGMKQKLALACTLIHKPEILLLDEPTTGVDPVSRRDFWKILSELLHTGITIILTTPYLDEAERCSRVALINKGKLLQVGTPSEIKNLYKNNLFEIISNDIRRTYTLLKENSLVIEVQAFGDRIDFAISNENNLHEIKSYLKGKNIIIENIRQISPTLENVFISYLTEKI